MHIADFSTLATNKSEPLADHLGRVRDAFLAADLGEPTVSFRLADAPVTGESAGSAELAAIKRVSAVDRLLKRFPVLARFVRQIGQLGAGSATVRSLTNRLEAGRIEPVEFSLLAEIAAGVPRSFPFHNATFHFSAPGFADLPGMDAFSDPGTVSMLMRAGVDFGGGAPSLPGVTVKDSWWVNGRNRSMGGLHVVEADPGARQLPPPPPRVSAALAACGKPRKIIQVPIVLGESATAVSPPPDLKSTPTGEALLALLRRHRERLGDLALPHDVPLHPEPEAGDQPSPGSGPKQPELDRCFEPMGYACRGGSGTFTLTRRTAGNLTVELLLDVGTWSDSLSASYAVAGLVDGKGFRLRMGLPPAPQAPRGLVHGTETVGQMRIGGADRWRRLVENLAALVEMLDRDFAPEVEAVAGPSPAWYRPDEPGAG